MKTVEHVMIADVVTIDAGRTAGEAVALMLSRNTSVLPVVHRDGLVGLITMRELLRALPYRTVAELMRRDVLPVSSHTPLTGALALMERQQLSQLPVIDDGHVIGIVSAEGIVKALGLPTDPLTELPWSVAVRVRAVELLKEGLEIAILFLDLDDFGLVNKRFGHVLGDRCIQVVAKTLLAAVDPDRETLCRYGGDEFAILTVRHREEAEALGNSLVGAIAALRIPGAPEAFALSASLGIAGGKRTTERQDIHYEATVDDLITMASRQSTQSKIEKSGTIPTWAEGVTLPRRRLRLLRVSLASDGGRARAAVELGLDQMRFTGEATGTLGPLQWRALAESTVVAVNQALPSEWKAAMEQVSILGSGKTNVVTVTVRLMRADGGTQWLAGSVAADEDLAPAVVKATLQALNRRLDRLLTERASANPVS